MALPGGPPVGALAFALLAALASCQGLVIDLAGPSTNVADHHRSSYGAGSVSPLEEPILELLKSLAAQDSGRRHMKALLHEQESYDFTPGLSTTEILFRSGFKFETHNCTAPDGYTTRLVRVVNPYVRRADLRRHPVALYTGQGTSPAAFLMAALGSERPRRWSAHASGEAGGQRSARNHDQPGPPAGREGERGAEPEAGDFDLHARLEGQASRSLAATLANNGYDVWIVPTRGVDAQNRARAPADGCPGAARTNLTDDTVNLLRNLERAGPGAAPNVSRPLDEQIRHEARLARAQNYWSFSNDEIIEKEFEPQLELVRTISGADKLSLVSYSNGGFITFGFLARHPDYAERHLDVIVNLAPAVFVNKFNVVLGITGLYSHLSPDLWPTPADGVASVARTSLVLLCRSRSIRYSLCKVLLDQLYGSSDLFNTHLELAIFDYIGRPTSGPALRQLLQTAYSGRMRQYEQGLIANWVLYGRPEPHDYELAAVSHPRNYIISADCDAIADPDSLDKLVKQLGHKPADWLRIRGYNHLDLLAGHDNAERVNQPLLEILNNRQLDLEFYREPDHEDQADGGAYSREATAGHERDFKNYHVGADHEHQHEGQGFVVDEHEQHHEREPHHEREQNQNHEQEQEHHHEQEQEHHHDHEQEHHHDHEQEHHHDHEQEHHHKQEHHHEQEPEHEQHHEREPHHEREQNQNHDHEQEHHHEQEQEHHHEQEQEHHHDHEQEHHHEQEQEHHHEQEQEHEQHHEQEHYLAQEHHQEQERELQHEQDQEHEQSAGVVATDAAVVAAAPTATTDSLPVQKEQQLPADKRPRLAGGPQPTAIN